MEYYSLHFFPVILLIASCIKTRNSQSKESRTQNPTYGGLLSIQSFMKCIVFLGGAVLLLLKSVF